MICLRSRPLGQIEEFIAQEEARGVGPIDRAELDQLKAPQSKDQTSHSPSVGCLTFGLHFESDRFQLVRLFIGEFRRAFCDLPFTQQVGILTKHIEESRDRRNIAKISRHEFDWIGNHIPDWIKNNISYTGGGFGGGGLTNASFGSSGSALSAGERGMYASMIRQYGGDEASNLLKIYGTEGATSYYGDYVNGRPELSKTMVAEDEAAPINDQTYFYAVEVLAPLIFAMELPVPLILPLQNGGIGAEWHDHGMNIELRFRNPYHIYAVLEDARREILPFHGRDPHLVRARVALQEFTTRASERD